MHLLIVTHTSETTVKAAETLKERLSSSADVELIQVPTYDLPSTELKQDTMVLAIGVVARMMVEQWNPHGHPVLHFSTKEAKDKKTAGRVKQLLESENIRVDGTTTLSKREVRELAQAVIYGREDKGSRLLVHLSDGRIIEVSSDRQEVDGSTVITPTELALVALAASTLDIERVEIERKK